VKVVDANVLIYAVDETSPHHLAAHTWLDDALSHVEPVIIPWICILAFIRITTHQGLSASPLSVNQAMDIVDSWVASPAVRTDYSTPQAADLLRRNLEENGVGGNLVNDAWLAALAVEADAELVSFDNDFQRFAGVRWFNPSHRTKK